ncbi:nucleotidyltransferase domain-containing protein [Hymenobacter sedentarius]|uniref:nucleotidyltransferase domain-containing protein n=1 Tax=Hymenobacter sedentarius TaxID=1411621 RepID=UPI0009005969|nr:nucleotidyltransferase domain-containing protein [Hymenobacter sedentarius]
MFTQSAVLERVKAFAESIRGQHISLRKVILFGSYARNEQRQFSDIDVALVADEFTGFGFQDVGLISNAIIQKQFVDIEPHTFSPEQFTDWNPFVQEILRTGIVVGEWGPAPQNQSMHM